MNKEKVRKCALDIRDVPPSAYALPNDGRKWRLKQKQRKQMVDYFASWASPDGSSVKVGVTHAREALGWGHSYFHQLLSELRELGVIENKGQLGPHGTELRRINVERILQLQQSAIANSRGPRLETQGSAIASSGVRDSQLRGPRLETQGSDLGAETTVVLPKNTPTHTGTSEACVMCVDEKPKEGNTVASTTTVDTKVEPHSAPPPASRQLDAAGAKAVVGKLLAKGDGEGDTLPITLNQRSLLEALAIQYGEEKFLAAGNAWGREHPWNARTTDPYVKLIAGFESYVAKARRVEKQTEWDKEHGPDSPAVKAAVAAFAKSHTERWQPEDKAARVAELAEAQKALDEL